jgi:protein-disulfide isomerase
LSVEANVVPKLDFLQRELGLSDETLRERVVGNPVFVGYSVEGRLRPRIKLCRELGLPVERMLFSYHSRTPDYFEALCRRAALEAPMRRAPKRARALTMSITPKTPLGHRIGAADAPVKLEAWYDFACPFSAKSFLTLTREVLPAVEARSPGGVQFLHYQYPQPWHAPGAYATEVSLAVELIDPSKYLPTCAYFFERQQELVFDCVSYDLTRAEMYSRLAAAAADASGVDPGAVMEQVAFLGTSPNAGNAVGQLVKWYANHGRKNGIHVTPTVLVNGIEEPSISSGWTPGEWAEYLDAKLA